MVYEVKLRQLFGEKSLEEVFNLARTALSEGKRVDLSRDEFEYLLTMYRTFRENNFFRTKNMFGLERGAYTLPNIPWVFGYRAIGEGETVGFIHPFIYSPEEVAYYRELEIGRAYLDDWQEIYRRTLPRVLSFASSKAKIV